MIDERAAVARSVEAPSARGSVRKRGFAGWVDMRGRRLGGWAFALNRATGLGVLLYLYLHLGILSLLARGPSAWDGFVSLATNPAFLLLDVVLLFGLLAHGLNGLRIGLVGFGMIVNRQRAMFVSAMILGAIVFLIGAFRIFTETGAR